MHFGHPKDKPTAIVNLVYGQGLLSFKPEANLAGQVSRVEVYGWNPKTKEKIVGVASTGKNPASPARARVNYLQPFVRDASKRPTLRLRQPVFTQAEANQRAKAALNEQAKQFLTGEGETIGLPEIRPDRNVALDGLGIAVFQDLLHPAGNAQDRHERLSHPLQGEGDRHYERSFDPPRTAKPRTKPAATSKASPSPS